MINRNIPFLLQEKSRKILGFFQNGCTFGDIRNGVSDPQMKILKFVNSVILPNAIRSLLKQSLHACSDEVAEWLRRWTANPLGSARVGSNPILVAHNDGSMV